MFFGWNKKYESSSYYKYMISDPYDDDINFEEGCKFVSLPESTFGITYHRYFLNEMPCCYLIDWINDVLIECKKKNILSELLIAYENQVDGYKIEKNDTKSIGEIVGGRYIELLVDFEDNSE